MRSAISVQRRGDQFGNHQLFCKYRLLSEKIPYSSRPFEPPRRFKEEGAFWPKTSGYAPQSPVDVHSPEFTWRCAPLGKFLISRSLFVLMARWSVFLATPKRNGGQENGKGRYG